MSDDEFQIKLVERRARERLIGRGIRNDLVQKGFLPGEVSGETQSRYYGKKKRKKR